MKNFKFIALLAIFAFLATMAFSPPDVEQTTKGELIEITVDQITTDEVVVASNIRQCLACHNPIPGGDVTYCPKRLPPDPGALLTEVTLMKTLDAKEFTQCPTKTDIVLAPYKTNERGAIGELTNFMNLL